MRVSAILLGAVASIGTAMVLAFFLFLRDQRGGEYVERMAEVEDHRMVSSLTELEMSRPLSERVLIPLRDRFNASVSSRTPASQDRRIRQLITAAGRPRGVTVPRMVVAKFFYTILAACLGAFLFLPFVKVPFPLSLLGLGAGFLGWMLPEQWLKRKAATRRQLLERAIPDTLDLLTICLDAGLAFDAAINEISEKVPGPMGQELTTTMTDIRLGGSRTDALQDMADRVQVEDWSDFTQAIITSRNLGVPIREMVTVQSAEIRRRRRQRTEEKAAQASLKMMFPMIGCIFPTLFIVLLGPVALMLIHTSK